MRKGQLMHPERHAFAAAGSFSINQFADHLQIDYNTAKNWLRANGYETISEREDTDVSPRSIDSAYYALLGSIVLGWTSKQALKEIAQ